MLKRTRQILTIFFILSSFIGFGQVSSSVLDSYTQEVFNLEVNLKTDQYAFQRILIEREQNDTYSHIDSSKNEYIFINESFTYLDSSTAIIEEYFNAGDSIPRFVYIDDTLVKKLDMYVNYYRFLKKNAQNEDLLSPKIKEFKSYATFQELAYNKTQIIEVGCVRLDEKGVLFKELMTKKLKASYTINTFINNKTKEVWISFQYAPKEPVFEIESRNSVWGF